MTGARNPKEADRPPAKTSTERVRDLRDRKAKIGHAEVRGVFAHVEDHQAIKLAAQKIVRKRAGRST